MARQKQKKNLFVRLKGWFLGLEKWKKIVLIAAVAIVIIGAAVGGFALSKLNKMERASIDESKLSIVDVDGYINILLLGVDTRDMKDIEGSRSDAIMVVSINEKTKDVNLISLYRDTYLKLGDTSTYDKITHACSYGGPEMTVASLNQALDLNINNYVVVNFKAVADLVDAVGGITLNIEDYEIDQLNKYTRATARNIGQKKYNQVTKPGEQTISGVQAVSYGRIRKGVGDDYKRTERMRTVLSLVFEQLKTKNVKELNDIADMMLPQVKTTLTNGDILALSLRLGSYKINGSTGFPYSVTGGSINKVSYVIPSDLVGDVTRLHREMFGQEGYSVSSSCHEIAAGIVTKVEASKMEVEKEKLKKLKETAKKQEENKKKPDKNSAEGTNTEPVKPETPEGEGTGGAEGGEEVPGENPENAS